MVRDGNHRINRWIVGGAGIGCCDQSDVKPLGVAPISQKCWWVNSPPSTFSVLELQAQDKPSGFTLLAQHAEPFFQSDNSVFQAFLRIGIGDTRMAIRPKGCTWHEGESYLRLLGTDIVH